MGRYVRIARTGSSRTVEADVNRALESIAEAHGSVKEVRYRLNVDYRGRTTRGACIVYEAKHEIAAPQKRVAEPDPR